MSVESEQNRRLQARLGQVKGVKAVETPRKIVSAPARIKVAKGVRENDFPKAQPFVFKVYEGRDEVASRNINRTRSMHQTLAQRLWAAAQRLAKEHKTADLVVVYAGEGGVDYVYGTENVVFPEGEKVATYRVSMLLGSEY